MSCRDLIDEGFVENQVKSIIYNYSKFTVARLRQACVVEWLKTAAIHFRNQPLGCIHLLGLSTLWAYGSKESQALFRVWMHGAIMGGPVGKANLPRRWRLMK